MCAQPTSSFIESRCTTTALPFPTLFVELVFSLNGKLLKSRAVGFVIEVAVEGRSSVVAERRKYVG